MTKQSVEQAITENDIREKVRTCMLKVKKDEAFTSHSLITSDLNIIKDGSDKEKMAQFLKLVCSELNIKKKKKKFICKRLEGISFVTEEISNFNPNKATSEIINVINNNKQAPSTSNDDSVPHTTTDDDAEVVKKSKEKRHRSSKSPQNLSKGKRRRSGVYLSFSADEQTQYAAEVKMEFESEKEKVLDSLDAKYKDLFGKIAFCKWKTDPYRPVLICSPYSISPDLGETWMKMLKNTKGDTKRMWYYIYWYGSPLEEAYTQSKKKDFVIYEEAEKRELHLLDAKIQKKIEKGKKLSRSEEQTVRGFKELEIELSKKPSQRRPEDFVEYHDAILDLDDTVSIPDEDSGIKMIENDSTDSESSESDEVESEEEPPVKEVKKVEKTEGYKDGAVANNITAINAKKDDDGSSCNIDVGWKTKKPIAKGWEKKKGTSTPAERNKKKSSVKENYPNTDEGLVQKRRDVLLLGKRRGKEREAYKKCCELFQDLTEEFQDAIEKVDYKKVMKCMKDIKSRDVSKLTAPFMKETKLPILVKRAKCMLVDSSNKKHMKDLYDELRNVYDEKKDDLPEGWREIQRSPIKATAKEARQNILDLKDTVSIPDEDSQLQMLESDSTDVERLEYDKGERGKEYLSKLENESRMKDQDIAKHLEKIKQLECEVDSSKYLVDEIIHLETENKRIQELLNQDDEKTERIKQLQNEVALLKKDRDTEIQNNLSRAAENLIKQESQSKKIIELQNQLKSAKGQISEL